MPASIGGLFLSAPPVSAFFPIRLASRRLLNPSVLHLTFVRDDGQALDYTPGQFIQIHFPLADGSMARRSYSCATRHDHHIAPGEAVEFVASVVPGGAATALFLGMAIGDVLQASGPLGLFTLRDDDTHARILLIATGTGIASYRSMLPELERRIVERGTRVTILHGVRTPEELLFADEFAAMARKYPALFEYRAAFSRDTFDDDDPMRAHCAARVGYVQAVLPELQPSAGQDVAYICGNPNMVDAVIAALKEFGLPMKDIRREKYVSVK